MRDIRVNYYQWLRLPFLYSSSLVFIINAHLRDWEAVFEIRNRASEHRISLKLFLCFCLSAQVTICDVASGFNQFNFNQNKEVRTGDLRDT